MVYQIMTKREDLSGRQFGQWRVLRFDHVTIHCDAFWLCVCDCGTFKRVPRGRLLIADRTAGGCGHDAYTRAADQNRAKPDSLDLFNGRYVAYRTRAKRGGLVFELTLAEFAGLVQQDCHYCDAPPAMLPRSRPAVAGDPLVNGVDRVDSARGYTSDNVVACCAICNRMKLDLAESVFLEQVRRIAAKHCR